MMKNNAEIHLIIPGICGPVAEIHSLQSNHEIKKWITTLSRAACLSSEESLYDVIKTVTGLQYDQSFPSAAFSLLAKNIEKNTSDTIRHYMHADPVHLQADLDHAILTSSADLNITEDQSRGLCDSLNQHFEPDDLFFERITKDEWLVSGPDKIEMDTTPLSQAVARNVNFILPKGKGADYWKKILTEAQMLMYSSDINTARENAGEQSINSLWFFGSGELPAFERGMVNSICSNDIMLKGLAQYINSEYKTVPLSVNQYIDYLISSKQGRVNLLHLSELEHLINYTDISIWLKKLTEVLENWLYPLLQLANKNNIKVILYPCDSKKYHFSKYDTLRFWRKGKLDNFISTY